MGRNLCTNCWKPLPKAHLLNQPNPPKLGITEIDCCRKAALFLNTIRPIAWVEYIEQAKSINRTELTRLSAILTQNPSRHCHWSNLKKVDQQLFNIVVVSYPYLSLKREIYYININELLFNNSHINQGLVDRLSLLVRHDIILPLSTIYSQ